MAEKSGFSFAAVITSFLMIWGGTVLAVAVAARLGLTAAWVAYALPAAGGFVGGFFAARASRGSTILEPGIGAVLFLGSLVGLAALIPDVPQVFRWILGDADARQAVLGPMAKLAGAGLGGAVAGAFVSEKLLGESSPHAFPWILYSALATFGGTGVGLLAGALAAGRAGGSDDAMGGAVLGAMAGACLLAGLAAGAQTRTRALLANSLGGAVGVAAFVFLVSALGAPDDKSKSYTVAAVLAVGAFLVTLLGTAIGWAVVGKRGAARP